MTQENDTTQPPAASLSTRRNFIRQVAGLAAIGLVNSSAQAESPGGHTVVEYNDCVVIKIQDPASLYLKHNENPNGVDYFKGDEVVVNGPLFNDKGNPVGGYIEDGVWKQPIVTPQSGGGNFADTNGFIGQKKNGSFFLLTYEEFQNKSFADRDIKWAFQNGPILLENGVNPHSSTTPTNDIARTALGFDREGDLVIVASKTPSNMYQLGNYLKREGVNNAIFLDGLNVGYIENGRQHGNIPVNSTPIHITTQGTLARFGLNN